MDDSDDTIGGPAPALQHPDRGSRQTRRLPFEDSLCWRCAHHRAIKTARSLFVLCRELPLKYPPQPIDACPLFLRE